jgi:Tol biopolymer transport system component
MGFAAYGQVPKGKIIFVSGQQGASNLYSINSDGAGERQITFSDKQNDLPSVFHNRIVYRQTTEKSNGIAGIMVTGINGGPVKTLIGYEEHKVVCYPKWKPDGALIAYEYYPGNNSQEIWVMDSNGNNKHKFIADARHPCWSYDNKKIFFTRNYEIYSMDLETGKQTQLTHMGSEHIPVKFPAISPGGEQLAFVAYYEKYPAVLVVDLKGNENRKTIKNCGDTPCWTNDPKYILCECIANNKSWQIAMVNVETGEKTFITHNNTDNYFPVWVSEE